MPNVLVVYYYTRPYPPRASIRDHLQSFGRHASGHAFYFNAALRTRPWWARLVQFDLVVFHTTLLSVRWNRPRFERLMKRLAWLRGVPCPKAAIPQDEFLLTDLLCRFIDELAVKHVFSIGSPECWPLIYADLRSSDVRFTQVLTGYLEDTTLARIERLAQATQSRSIDIGYRTWRESAWLGRHGMLKTQIAEQVTSGASQRRLDISTRPDDMLLGDKWYQFLLSCKYTIGVEGGASLLDRDGSARDRTEQYVAQHPRAGFDEIEARCFPGLDGNLRLFAMSPRHLEACATRTCQILVSGQYNGVLRPGEHYIELKRDFSNLDDILRQLDDEPRRRAITERAYRDIVASGRFSYRRFVEAVMQAACSAPRPSSILSRAIRSILATFARLEDRLAWGVVFLASRLLGCFGWSHRGPSPSRPQAQKPGPAPRASARAPRKASHI